MEIDTTQFKQKLEEEKDILIKELRDAGVQDPRNPANWEAKEKTLHTEDPNVAADTIEEVEKLHSLTNDLELRLKDVNDALAKIEAGTYGACEAGGKPIEPARLEANPAARTCMQHMSE